VELALRRTRVQLVICRCLSSRRSLIRLRRCPVSSRRRNHIRDVRSPACPERELRRQMAATSVQPERFDPSEMEYSCRFLFANRVAISDRIRMVASLRDRGCALSGLKSDCLNSASWIASTNILVLSSMAGEKRSKRMVHDVGHLTGDDELADAILRAVRRTLRKTLEHSRNVFNQSGLTVPQLLCLRSIGQEASASDLTAAGLAERIQLSSVTISRTLDYLDSNGLIVRSWSRRDRRRVSVKLTRKARRSLSKLPTPLQEEFLQRPQDLPETKRKALLQSLEQIVEMMGASALDVASVLATEVSARLGDRCSPTSLGRRLPVHDVSPSTPISCLRGQTAAIRTEDHEPPRYSHVK